MANGKKKVRTITGGYSPDRRSQGTRHAELAKKRKAQKETQKRHQDLLTNYGKGTPRPKVKTVGVGSLAPKKYGPQNQPKKEEKIPLPKRKKAKTASSIKAGGLKKLGSGPEKKELKAEKMSYADQLKARKRARGVKKAVGLTKKADKAAKKGNLRKAARLEKRAVRKAERGAGRRKTAVGTALKTLGRGAQALGHAYAYGHTGRLKGNKVSRKNSGYEKPSPVSKTPLSTKFRVLGKTKDEKQK